MIRYARRQSVRAVAARSAGARSASLDAAKAISDLTATRSRRRGRAPTTEFRVRAPSRCYRHIYLSLTMLRDQGCSIHHSSRTSHMDQNLENLIRERAYEIWTSHGCVHGQADQHWLTAEREILRASTATLPGKPAPQTKRRLPARSKITKTLARAS
jgi:Protein of unknown function (DUF2934)